MLRAAVGGITKVRYRRSAAFVVAWALSTAPPVVQAWQHQHGGAPQPTRPDSRPETALRLKEVLKAADRSLATLEKAAQAGSYGAGAQAARDYLSLVGWVERHFLAPEMRGASDDRDAERARKALARQDRRLASIEGGEIGHPFKRLVGQARDAASAALAAVDSTTVGGQPDASPRGGCGHC